MKVKDYKLTNYELELMDVIWRQGEATVQDVCDGLSRELAYTTVMTTLSILANKKKVLDRIKQGRSYLYRPTVTREEVSISVLDHMKKVLLEDSPSKFVLNFLENEEISKDDIAAIKKAIRKLEKRK